MRTSTREVVILGLLVSSFLLNLVLLTPRTPRKATVNPPDITDGFNELSACKGALTECTRERDELWAIAGEREREFAEAARGEKLKPSDIFTFVPFVRQADFEAVIDSWAWQFHPSIHFVQSVAGADSVTMRHVDYSKHHWAVVGVPLGSGDESMKTLCSKVIQYLRWACSQQDVRAAKWIFKADTDTLVLTKNLAAALSSFDPNQDNYFGYIWRMVPYRLTRSFTWADGGAGYVISRSAFSKLCASNLWNITAEAADAFKYEDVLVGHLLGLVKVPPNPILRPMFSHFLPSEWRHKNIAKTGAVTFHGIKDSKCLREIGAIVDYLTGARRP